MPSLDDQIVDALLLVRGARERGDTEVELIHSQRLDDLLARVPHPSRF